MWTCPNCGRSFANKNQWHACQTTTVEDVLDRKSDLAISIYHAVEAALERSGDFRVHAQKTRIAFISRMTFAGVSLARRWADLFFILPEPLDNDRIRRLELYGPTSWGHTIRLESPADVDADVEVWLARSLKRGDQVTLDPSADVRALGTQQLEVFWTGFSAAVELFEDDLVVPLPGYVADALALVDEVSLRIGGVKQNATLIRDGSRSLVALDPSLGLGQGDVTDVFIEVD